MIDFHEVGAIWPNWVLDEEIGHGSYGTVYRAHRVNAYSTAEQLAAVKHIGVPSESTAEDLGSYSAETIRSVIENQKNQVRRELAAMVELHGKQHIVAYEEHRIIERTDRPGFDLFLRMELLSSLSVYIKQHENNRIMSREVAVLGHQIGEALRVLHRRGFMHRDIKPANIFVDRDGDFKLGDFGTTRMVDNKGNASTRVGTLNYMAPEVYSGIQTYDQTTDIYSLGIVLYRMLNNNFLPFTDDSNPDTSVAMDRRMQGLPVPRPIYGDPDLVRIVMKCIAFKPRDRYQQAVALVNDLEDWLLKRPTGWVCPQDYTPCNGPDPEVRDPMVISDALWVSDTGKHGTDPWYVPAHGLPRATIPVSPAVPAPVIPVTAAGQAAVQTPVPVTNAAGRVSPPVTAPMPGVVQPNSTAGSNAFRVPVTPAGAAPQSFSMPMAPVPTPAAAQPNSTAGSSAFRVPGASTGAPQPFSLPTAPVPMPITPAPMAPVPAPMPAPVSIPSMPQAPFKLNSTASGSFRVPSVPSQQPLQPIDLPAAPAVSDPNAFHLNSTAANASFRVPSVPGNSTGILSTTYDLNDPDNT